MKKKLILLVLFIVIMMISYFHLQIMTTASKTPPGEVDYLIVLGAKVNGEEMSPSLYNRAQKALEYLQNNLDTKVILTGGQGPDEGIAEAEALRRFFEKEGLQKDRILIEDRSTSTYENLLFTKKLYGIEKAVIVSNDFHLYRSVKLAEKLKIEAYPLAAETPATKKKKNIHVFKRICSNLENVHFW
ncbi:YdcF family protein [Bacillus aquiflavi]|uniref:YdcF family protein n=1 Tax=Bacillus aquiflavi TaxID=2672567 RepID=UPI001CA9002F|nr:YdcF family protein [Bacillus aquiflavi]UAC49858.1 YdcF family protein [Bacillus aquiflavi]